MPRIPDAQGRATQPKALERVVRRVHDQLATADGGGASSRPAFVGVGASYAALALPMEILCAAGVPARRELASELRATDADLLLGVSQSGRSPETIDALGLVPRSRRTALVNVTPSLLGESVDRLVDLGNEDDSYASTIGYTGTQVALAMIARTMLGWTADEAAAEWAGIAATLAAFEAAVAGPVDEVAALARTVVAADFVASGAARSATESGALLLREVCRVPAAALVTRNYLHGEMESAGATLHVIVGDDRELELARSLARAGHLTLCVTSALLDPEDSLHVVTVPGDLPLPVRAVLQTAVAQRLAGSLALARGVDIEEFVFHNSDTKLGGTRGMTRLIAGADIGGTKTHIRTALVEVPDDAPAPGEPPQVVGVVADLVLPSDGWQATPPAKAAAWLAERLPPGDLSHLAVGAHACETPAQCAALAAELRALLGLPVTVVNDAELLVPAAGLPGGVGVIAGTGSIAVGRHAVTGEYLSAGGWGWVLGDEGSASALVREAAKAVLARADEGGEPDELGRALLRSYGVPGLPELAAAMSWDSGVETWGAHAPAVFAAAEAGSPLAAEVIAAGGRALARLVALLAARGAAAGAVVVAGGVITARPALMAAFEEELSALLPGTGARLLDQPPVSGAIELARRAMRY